jgi:hypothetical protein
MREEKSLEKAGGECIGSEIGEQAAASLACARYTQTHLRIAAIKAHQNLPINRGISFIAATHTHRACWKMWKAPPGRNRFASERQGLFCILPMHCAPVNLF